MADSSKLATWLVDNAEALNLQVKRLHWVRDWKLSQWSDVQVSIDIEGRTFIGRGTARGEELAFVKAGAEAIERAYCSGHQIHTMGVAAHTSIASAQENVLNELNERDAFFCHFYTKTPFLPLPESYLSDQTRSFMGAFDEIRSLGIGLRLFRALSYGNPVFVCIAEGQRASPAWGGIIGLGSNAHEPRAIESAFFECLRNVAAVAVNGPPETLTKEDFAQIQSPTSQDRQCLAMNVDYWKEIAFLFPDRLGKNLPLPPKATVSVSWIVEKLDCPFPILRVAPVVVYRARLDESNGDTLFRGKDRSPTTLARLSEFLGHVVQDENLESKPHFLG